MKLSDIINFYVFTLIILSFNFDYAYCNGKNTFGGINVLTLGNSELHKNCSLVTVQSIISNETYVMKAREDSHAVLRDFRSKMGFGRAIAAPQIGYSIRMIAMNICGKEITLYNPEITHKSDETFTMWDDCLSFPDQMCCVRSHNSISIQFIDDNGNNISWNNCTRDISELLQHEIDHLNGILATQIAISPNNLSESIIKRDDWLANKELYNSYVDYSIQ